MPRILIIHTEPRARGFLARALAAEGFDVDVATNGEHGLTCALARRYELALLGFGLHDGDGFEVLRELNRQEQDLAVIVLAPHGDLVTKLRGFELGAVDCMSHPFSLDELLARVRIHLRRPRAAERSEALRVIRRRLGPHAPIETVRNAGYRAVA